MEVDTLSLTISVSRSTFVEVDKTSSDAASKYSETEGGKELEREGGWVGVKLWEGDPHDPNVTRSSLHSIVYVILCLGQNVFLVKWAHAIYIPTATRPSFNTTKSHTSISVRTV